MSTGSRPAIVKAAEERRSGCGGDLPLAALELLDTEQAVDLLVLVLLGRHRLHVLGGRAHLLGRDHGVEGPAHVVPRPPETLTSALSGHGVVRMPAG